MNTKDNNIRSIKIRNLRIDDYEVVLNWSKDDIFVQRMAGRKIEVKKNCIDSGFIV
ncbi:MULTISPECIES: hypothetical protein [Psychrobacillus]|uniref:hypothetical protein n=1 Tax=Psychrobacillus TaxID=1221880 RepID=UPI001CD91708|nr:MULTISPECIES: hypothetical protein [Psychrobacillus]